MTELVATYRLQLGASLRFADAASLAGYLERLGVSHLHLSPIWQARAGSPHGYDIVDPNRVSDALGGEPGLVELAGGALGIVLDVVPNHMAADAANPYWRDEAVRTRVFDIDEATGARRRFFDVDDLVGVRVEDPGVFAETHRKLAELLGRGIVDGVRVDHVDGLADPGGYLVRLRDLGAHHIWVEKILAPDEVLRPWPVDGTTGYDFLNDATGLFVDPASEDAFTELAGERRGFAEIATEAKGEQAVTTFRPETEWLRRLFDSDSLAGALAALPVYRTYLRPGEGPTDNADRLAVADLPEPVRSVFLGDIGAPGEFVTRFQQTTGAVMAKGVEDTALYRYVRMLALNEVGGDPGRFGLSTGEFHRRNLERASRFPHALLASQTHDTKRSGDVRARLAALTHVPEAWRAAVAAWHELGSPMRSPGGPDWTEELFIYETLVGGWPIGMERLGPYLRKSLREAKRHTSWTIPDERWEDEVIGYCERLVGDPEFLASFEPFAATIALAGERISLAQLALQLSAPGTPDLYQGDETWCYAFVDPDNRRPVDWRANRELLAALAEGREPPNRANAKLFLTRAMLALRRRRLDSFHGPYQPLGGGPGTCAYRRGNDVVVAVALRGQIAFELPAGSWQEVLAPIGELYPPAPVRVFERAA